MMRKIINICVKCNITNLRNFSTNLINVTSNIKDDLVKEPFKNEENSIFQEPKEDLSYINTYLKPTFNFGAYINKSESLQELFKLGVNFFKLEKNIDCVPYILSLNFDKDIKNHVLFFYDIGLQREDIGNLITMNPFIFKEDLDNLQVRINYLKFKKFTDDSILFIVKKNPIWLTLNTQTIDEKLGYFQKTFKLKGDEVRYLTIKRPKLITYDLNKIRKNNFVLKEEMGFSDDEIKQILLRSPNLFINSQHKILPTFEYIHNTMKIPLETIVKFPNALTCREFRIKQRHLFLEKLEKSQYDSKLPNYISLHDLVSGDDSKFATEVAKSSVQLFNAFIKAM